MLPSSMNISLDLFFSKFMMPEICLLMTVKSFLWTENQPIRSRFLYFLCICFSPEKWPLNARFGSTFVYWLIYFGISRISFLAQAAGSDSCCLWIRF